MSCLSYMCAVIMFVAVLTYFFSFRCFVNENFSLAWSLSFHFAAFRLLLRSSDVAARIGVLH